MKDDDIIAKVIPIVIGGVIVQIILYKFIIPPPPNTPAPLPAPPSISSLIEKQPRQTLPFEQKPSGIQDAPLKEVNLAYTQCSKDLLLNPIGRKGFESQQKWLRECTRRKLIDKT